MVFQYDISSQILTVLLDHFEGDILMVGPFLFRFFQISFACGILVLEHGFRQKIGFGYSNRTFMDFRVSLNVEPAVYSSLSGFGISVSFFKVFFDVRILTKRVFVSLDIAE
ncbi:hypothetical protein RhiirC2_707638 [Rhizophagus irregularis]|uniref:Uncharacterized protein n=1 Tax=Rhizophagus irregularis TaxID=588596 RepID=A0A2N1NQF3_9GLOM|nr:hypothetical protein RhiirC2_707638 [Rhizophagus irregularis]